MAIVGDELIGLDVRFVESGNADFHERQAGEAVSFSADGKWFVAARCSNDPGTGSLLVWKLGDSTALPTAGKALRVGATALSPSGTWAAAASQFGGPALHVWDAASGAEIQTIRYPPLSQDRSEPYRWVTSMSYSPDGRTLAAGGFGEVAFWPVDPASGKLEEPPRIFSGHAPHVWSVNFNPAGSRVVVAGNDGAVRVCRLPDGSVESTFQLGHRHDVIRQAVFTSDGRHIVTANGHGTICILRLPAITDGK